MGKPLPQGTHRSEVKEMKLTKIQMLDEVIIARKKKMSDVEIQNARYYVKYRTISYVTKVYELFLTDKEHVEFYYALLVR